MSTGLFLVRRENLHHPADLLVPPDDRIQLAGGGQGRVVLGVLLQAREFLFGLLVLHPGTLAHFADGRLQLRAVQAEALEHLPGVGVGVGQREQQGVRGQEAVAEAPPCVAGHLQEVPESRPDLGFRAAHGAGQLRDQILSAVAQPLDGLGAQARPFQQGMQAGLGGHEGQEQMLGHQLRVLILEGPLPRGHQGVVGFLGEGQEGHGPPRQGHDGSNMMR
jgi:hypothetical protein